LLASPVDQVLMLDVREPFEERICRIEGSKHVPLRALSRRLAELPRNRRILVLCHHGGRSRQATAYLRAHGFPAASNVQGGIDAWATRIDPAMRRY
jgi:rhodanese-related sulfurtransferase